MEPMVMLDEAAAFHGAGGVAGRCDGDAREEEDERPDTDTDTDTDTDAAAGAGVRGAGLALASWSSVRASAWASSRWLRVATAPTMATAAMAPTTMPAIDATSVTDAAQRPSALQPPTQPRQRTHSPDAAT